MKRPIDLDKLEQPSGTMQNVCIVDQESFHALIDELRVARRVVTAAMQIYAKRQGSRYTCWAPIQDPNDWFHALPCGNCPGCQFQQALAEWEVSE